MISDYCHFSSFRHPIRCTALLYTLYSLSPPIYWCSALVSRPVPSRPVPPRPAPSHPLPPRPVSPRPVLSRPISSCPVLSCPIFFLLTSWRSYDQVGIALERRRWSCGAHSAAADHCGSRKRGTGETAEARGRSGQHTSPLPTRTVRCGAVRYGTVRQEDTIVTLL